MKTDLKCLADVEFQLQWKSHYGNHRDCFFARRVNFWLDILPKQLSEGLMNRSVGDAVEVSFKPGELAHRADPAKLFRIRRSQFDETFRPGVITRPLQGRFYPKGIVKDVTNVFRANREPFRCAEVNGSDIVVDFSHPLAGLELQLKAIIRGIESERAEKGGGMCNDWMETVATGPGMQSRWNGQPTDFLSGSPFERSDRAADSSFYQKPRFVDHIDSAAIANVSQLYGKTLDSGSNVLDLMSSWKSHIPPQLKLKGVTGLGMNREELEKNEQLTDYVVQDLNANPVLPFADGFFDSVICTVSVEYLTNPPAVFREVGRVLKKGGCFILTFSNRWFPPKVISIWENLYEFERVGLVSEYFLLSERFKNMNTCSVRGLPRPKEDKYYGEVFTSDPVYGVWAYRE